MPFIHALDDQLMIYPITTLIVLSVGAGWAIGWWYWRNQQNQDGQNNIDDALFVKDMSMDFVAEMRKDVAGLKQEVTALNAQRVKDSERITELYVGVMMLIGQLRGSGITPVWVPPPNLFRFDQVEAYKFVSMAQAVETLLTPSDLNVLMFDLGIKEGEVMGNTHAERVRRFLATIDNQHKTADLLRMLVKLRPHVKWDALR